MILLATIVSDTSNLMCVHTGLRHNFRGCKGGGVSHLRYERMRQRHFWQDSVQH